MTADYSKDTRPSSTSVRGLQVDISRASDEEVLSAMRLARELQLEAQIETQTRTHAQVELTARRALAPAYAASVLAALAVHAGRPRADVLREIGELIDEVCPRH